MTPRLTEAHRIASRRWKPTPNWRASPAPRTAREVLSDLLDNGCALLPALERRPARTGDGAEGEYTVAGAGYAILRNGALAGWTGGKARLGRTF